MMDYREIINGRRRDPLAVLIRFVLSIARAGYWIAIVVRNRAYDRKWLAVERCEATVVSIGNLTTGGTGKTPLVRYVARFLRDRDVRVALISRGYGASDGGLNDEAMELAATLPDVPHLQNPDRVVSARIAVDELESQLVLMDDGFQHRRLHRDIDILVIDATCPFGYGRLLPRGLLREPIAGVRRACAAVLTRSDAVDEAARTSIRERINRYNPSIIWAESVHRPTGLLRWPGNRLPLEAILGRSVAMLCGIGNPDAFAATIQQCGATVSRRIELADHAAYDQETISKIRQSILEWGDTITHIVCTHKDLVKIQTDTIAGKPLVALQIEIAMIVGKDAFDAMLMQLEV